MMLISVKRWCLKISRLSSHTHRMLSLIVLPSADHLIVSCDPVVLWREGQASFVSEKYEQAGGAGHLDLTISCRCQAPK